MTALAFPSCSSELESEGWAVNSFLPPQPSTSLEYYVVDHPKSKVHIIEQTEVVFKDDLLTLYTLCFFTIPNHPAITVNACNCSASIINTNIFEHQDWTLNRKLGPFNFLHMNFPGKEVYTLLQNYQQVSPIFLLPKFFSSWKQWHSQKRSSAETD